MVSDFKVTSWRFFIKSVIGHSNTVIRVQSIHSSFLVSTMATQEDAITIHSSTINNPSDCGSISSSSSSSVCLAGQFEETVEGRLQFIPEQKWERGGSNGRHKRIISPSSPPRRNRPVAPRPLPPADINVSSPEEDGSTSSIETCAGSTCSTSSWFLRLVSTMIMMLSLLVVWSFFVDDPTAASLSCCCYLFSSLLRVKKVNVRCRKI
jgi:hypothetical protein